MNKEDEQFLWVGEEKVKLQPQREGLDSIIRNERIHRAMEEDRVKREGLISLHKFIQEQEFSHQKTGKRYLDEEVPVVSELWRVWQLMLSQPELPESRAALEQFQKLAGQRLVDFGNGTAADDFQSLFAQFKPKSYIGIDEYNRFNMERPAEVKKYGHVMHYDTSVGDVLEGDLIRGDILEWASVLPDNFCSISLHGIDGIMFPTGAPFSEELKKDLVRILDPTGILFGISTEGRSILVELSGHAALKVEPASIPEHGIYILSKV
jgi:hypothetical protein